MWGDRKVEFGRGGGGMSEEEVGGGKRKGRDRKGERGQTGSDWGMAKERNG